MVPDLAGVTNPSVMPTKAVGVISLVTLRFVYLLEPSEMGKNAAKGHTNVC